MQDKDFHYQILGLQHPWMVRAIDLDLPGGEAVVRVQHDRQVALRGPECGTESPGYDSRKRRWRHQDTCQCRTMFSDNSIAAFCANIGDYYLSGRNS
jgi:transposase